MIGEHNDRHPIAVLDFWLFVELCQDAGRPELETNGKEQTP